VSSHPRSYFEEMYRHGPDPWDFETSWYEQRKYALTVAALPERRYRSCFEPGCSVGVLSALLAVRCDRLLSTDLSPVPLERARRRLAAWPGARVERRAVPEEWPQEVFDLVVLSEVAYYFDRPALDDLVGRTVVSTEHGGTVVAVHWRGDTDYPLTGDEAHEAIGAHPALVRVARHLEDRFVLEVWHRT
jgi:SAM-dependent methyltransferase